MRGDTYGVEAWADFQLADWWRLSPGVRTLHKRLRFEAGSSGLLGVAQAGNDPTNQALLRSSIDLGRRGTFDLNLRHTDTLPSPDTPGYYELNARFGWRWTDALEVAISGSICSIAGTSNTPRPRARPLAAASSREVRWAP